MAPVPPPGYDRRQFLAAGAASLGALAWRQRLRAQAAGPVTLAVPTPQQLAWQRDERALFLHFGMNTFTNREWGDGTESPALFNPTALDCRQWARAASTNGFRAMILVAKHHDGFCLWPSQLTRHSVASSPWRGGTGDVVREFVDACRGEGLHAGLYLSPWDRHEPSYGDSPRYNDFYCGQLTELLTQYGPLQEVWFDGANGEGPNGKKQIYDWPRVWALVRRLQPEVLMFSDAGPDIRWIGNERGYAGDPNWAAVDPAAVPFPGVSGAGVTAMLQHGDAHGPVWRPGEADVSIRPGWFYHATEDAKLKTVDALVDIYLASVGRNAKLLLNVPPTPAGLLAHGDVDRLAELNATLRRLLSPTAALWDLQWSGAEATRSLSRVGSVTFEHPRRVAIIALAEDVTRGQRVSSYRLEAQDAVSGSWTELTHGTTIGVRKLDRLPQSTLMQALRLTLHSDVAPPLPVQVTLFKA